MTISRQQNGTDLILSIAGRLDTTTAPELEDIIRNGLDGITSLTIDLKDLDYISSAGLRILLQASKSMNSKDGSLQISDPSPSIVEIFELTGFDTILTIV